MDTNRHVTNSSISLTLNKDTLRVLTDRYSKDGPVGTTTDVGTGNPTRHTNWSFCCSTGCECNSIDE